MARAHFGAEAVGDDKDRGAGAAGGGSAVSENGFADGNHKTGISFRNAAIRYRAVAANIFRQGGFPVMREQDRAVFEKARKFVYRNARPLDLARWKYHFGNGSEKEVIEVLSAYQNEDGGYAVNWDWEDYPEAWAVSKNWWKAEITVNNMISLERMS